MIFNILRSVAVCTTIFSLLGITNLRIRFNEFYNRSCSKEKRINQNIDIYLNMMSYINSLLFWIKIKVEGEKIDLSKQNYVIVSNHVSYLDTFIISNFIKQKTINSGKLRLIGMGPLLNIPIVGYIFSKLGMIPIKYNKDNSYNKESVEKVYSSVYENLEKKNTILLFPEGQLNDNPKIMNKIKSGAFNFSKKTNTPIKIVALKGIEKIWPKHKFPTGYGTISVKLFDNEYSFDNIEDYKKTVRYQIENFIKN